MATFGDNLKRTLLRGNIVTRLIGINAIVYLLCLVLKGVFMLFKVDVSSWLSTLMLPASLPQLLTQPWSLVTYMFMHASFTHLLFNMLWLWWFGQIFLYFFSARHLRGLYIVGGLAGGLLYLLAYNLFPLFADQVQSSVLVGASAAILAIVIATAVKAPDFKISLFLIGQLSLKWLALGTVIIDMLFIASTNAGGHIAHLGGALAGWWFASALTKGYDITAWVNAVFDFFGRIFSPGKTSKIRVKRQKKPISSGFSRKKKKAHYQENVANEHSADYEFNASRKQQTDEIDRILDKIKKSGYNGLTEAEKKKLFEASNKP
ncbi:MAG: rhomboid family intramembrane serine protease [Bacteroidaceae bacterium]|nr:rhomboid family intramembrane serine protease [Bacteroidaceae bacterium]